MTFQTFAEEAMRRYSKPSGEYAHNYALGLARAHALGRIVSGDAYLADYVTHLVGYAYAASDLRAAFQDGVEWCNHDWPAIDSDVVCECGVAVTFPQDAEANAIVDAAVAAGQPPWEDADTIQTDAVR